LNGNCGSQSAAADHAEEQMKAQDTATHSGGWIVLADFARPLAVALAAGMFFSLLSGLLVIIVSTIS
jgi:hypothetical protein